MGRVLNQDKLSLGDWVDWSQVDPRVVPQLPKPISLRNFYEDIMKILDSKSINRIQKIKGTDISLGSIASLVFFSGRPLCFVPANFSNSFLLIFAISLDAPFKPFLCLSFWPLMLRRLLVAVPCLQLFPSGPTRRAFL